MTDRCGSIDHCIVKSKIQASGIYDLMKNLRGAKERCNSYLVAKNITSIRNILAPYSDSCERIKPLLEKADFCIEQASNAKFGLTIEVTRYVNQFMAELQKFFE